jgi:2-polyprenyl-3-methyl-5-hydroxy-6-metoxy-1,4-benzoquinol methylase
VELPATIAVMDERLAVNRAMWDARVPVHVASDFYNVEGFRKGQLTIAPFELAEVGAVADRRLVHLQCHFGLDTLSWARLGADVTGLDFSPAALHEARRLAGETGLVARFVEATVDDASAALDGDFDIVYTSWGVLVWLPDLDDWAGTIAGLLRPGGFVYLTDEHPFAATLKADGHSFVEAWRYGGAAEVELVRHGTYADEDAPLHTRQFEWSHGLGEVVTALSDAGLRIEFLHERPVARWPMLSTLEKGDDDLWRLPGSTLPLSFSLKATKPGDPTASSGSR